MSPDIRNLYWTVMEFITIGFLGIYRFDNNATIRGGILVTDSSTKPLEFRVTASVRPQKFQEIVYGDILNEHVAVELMGLPLLNALDQKPNVVIVRDILLLGLNAKQSIPTICLLKDDESLIQKGTSTKSLNLSNSDRPLIKIHTSGQAELQIEEIVQNLQQIVEHRDLMEPFNRLEKACLDVHERKVGDR